MVRTLQAVVTHEHEAVRALTTPFGASARLLANFVYLVKAGRLLAESTTQVGFLARNMGYYMNNDKTIEFKQLQQLLKPVKVLAMEIENQAITLVHAGLQMTIGDANTKEATTYYKHVLQHMTRVAIQAANKDHLMSNVWW